MTAPHDDRSAPVPAGTGRDAPPGTAASLLCVALFALAVHLPARLGELYGEQDVARLVNDALLWTRAGVRTDALSQYRYYTSPAYIWLITLLLPGARDTLAPAAAALNAINLVVAVVITVPLFLLVRRIAGGRAALLGTLFLSVMPAFWQGGLYGFPSLPAALFLVLALWLFDRWLAGDGGPRAALPTLAACTLCLTASVLLKADVYLGAVALWGLLLYRRRLSWRGAALLAAVGVLPVVVLYGVATALLQESPGAFEYADAWRTTFPATPGRALTTAHVVQVVKSFGLLTLPLFAAALVVLLRARRYALAALLLAWAALPVAFWFPRWGDSARHHFQSTVPAALGVGILLAAWRVRDLWRYAALALIMAVNYLAFAPDASTLTTSGNLLGSARPTAQRLAVYHRLAREYAERDAPRSAFLGTLTNPFAENQVLWLADSVTSVRAAVRFGTSAREIEYLRDGRRHVAVIVYLPLPVRAGSETAAIAAAYRAAGYAVFSMQLFDGMRRRHRHVRDYRLTELPLP